jgi:hypothetical protein
MPTSGVDSYTITSVEIMQEALELLGVLGEGEIITLEARTSALRTLNMLIKNWQADGLNLFAVQNLFVFPQKGNLSYTLGTGSVDHATTSFYRTTVVSQSVSTEVQVADTVGMFVGDFIGFETTEDQMAWSTISALDNGTDTVTLTTPVTNLADEGQVVSYTTKAYKPMHVLEGYLRRASTDIPMGQISRREYGELSQKLAEGYPNQFWYDPQVTYGNLSVWPTGAEQTDVIVLYVQRPMDILQDQLGIDDLDYPMEWYLPLAYGLAKALAPKYGLPKDDYLRIITQSAEYYETARGFDTEMYTSVFFQPDTLQMSN